MMSSQRQPSAVIANRTVSRWWYSAVARRRPTTPLATVFVVMGVIGVLCQPVNVVAQAAPDGGTTRSGYATSSETIANPERGFYHHPGDCARNPLSAAALADQRRQRKITLVLCIFYLRGFTASDISADQLDFFSQQAGAVREAGFKMIVRFAYTDSDAGETADDASPEWVQRHLEQLAPLLKRNGDVIAVVESGFVGAWGEGYYTRHFGNRGVVSDADWCNRKAVVDGLLAILPGRMVQVRTPKMKRRMYGEARVQCANAGNTALAARVGHHNDCFLASDDDQGTYEDVSVEKPYLAADTKTVAMGGETCVLNPPRSNCPTALRELGTFHYSYLNKDHSKEVLDSWSRDGCMTDVERRLGYRLSLISSELPTSVTRGSTFTARFSIRNSGWAAPLNSRPVYLVLRSKTTPSSMIRIRLAADARRWGPGAPVAVTERVRIPPTVQTGEYDVLLSLPEPPHSLPRIPEPAGSLTSRPEYAIRLANPGVWEPSKGLNRLSHTVRVKPEVFINR